MKKVIIALIFLTYTYCKAQINSRENTETTIFLIGSVHKETDKITKNDFYTAIKNCKPDLILIELDSVMLNKDFSIPKDLKDYFEVGVVDSIIKNKKNIQLRPFDIEGRNSFFKNNQFYENQAKMFNDVFSLYEKDSLNFDSKLILENFISLNRITNSFSEMDLKTVNSSAYNKLVEIKLNSIYKYFPIIISSKKELEKHKEHLALDEMFWNKRNNAMAKNILSFSKIYQGKRIVVITGTFHLYFLKSLLEPKQKELNFKIKEYYELK